jgi:hypothetical protein
VDLLLTYTTPGASATNVNLQVHSWREVAFVTIFEEQLTNWAGGGDWSLEPTGEIITTCAALGAFDHKLLSHPLVTRTYRYDPAAGAFALEQYEREPPQTRRQAVNEAEAALSRGDLEEAIARYQQAVRGDYPAEEETPGADWVALAHLRLAMLHAFAGQAEAMQASLNVAAGSAPLEPLADALERGHEEDGVVGAWAALAALPLYDQFYHGDAIAAYPTTAALLRQTGYGAAAFLNEQPEVVALSGNEIAAAMRERGLPVERALIANLDDDPSAPELVVQMSLAAPEALADGGQMQEFWLLDQSAGASGFWAIYLTSLAGARLDEVAGDLPHVTLVDEEGGPLFRYEWDGSALHEVGEDGTRLAAGALATCEVR